MSYARGKYAFGFCDRTGFRYPLKDLVPEFQNGVKTGFLVGRDVADPDQPQNFLGRLKINDPQSLRNPRPDTALLASRELGGFNPVGNLSAQGEVGRVTVSALASDTLTGVAGTGSVGAATVNTNYTIQIVTVQSYSGSNRYYIDSSRQPTLSLSEGNTYRFDQADSSNSGHPFRFSTTSDGTHGGGSAYTTGVTTSGTPGSSGAYTQITVASGAPTLYYYCTNHSGMGGQANTP